MGNQQSVVSNMIGITSAGQNYSCDLVNGQLACAPSPPALMAENYLNCEAKSDGSGLLCQGIQANCMKVAGGGLSCKLDQVNAVGQMMLRNYAEVAGVPAPNVTLPTALAGANTYTIPTGQPAIVQPTATVTTLPATTSTVVMQNKAPSTGFGFWFLFLILIVIIIIIVLAYSNRARNAVVIGANKAEIDSKRAADNLANAFAGK